MPISMKKYVDIKSGINNIRTATEKDLIARIIYPDARLDPNKVYEFENLEEVGEFWGIDSEVYKIAEKYFSFINKYSRSPRKISFYRNWTNGVYPAIASTEETDFETLKAITNGNLELKIGNVSKSITGIDLSSATDDEDIASILQTAIRNSADGTQSFATANVQALSNAYIIASGTQEKVFVELAEETTLSNALKLENGKEQVEGRVAGTLEDVFKNCYEVSNNFATFWVDGYYSTAELATLANYVSQNYPSEFMMIIPVTTSDYSSIQSATENINGVSLELCGTTDETKYNYVLPMAITATTDYNKENGTVNYMFTQDNNMAVMVDSDDEAEQYDELKINYYGRTQQAGQKLAFYQNGVLQGNYQDQSIYVNEIWLKDALTTKYINYMLLTPNWYANQSGQAIGQGLIADVIERAKLNGTITTEKEMSEEDKVYIYNITADENAWRQIYQEGYYLITSISKEKVNNQDTYKFNYTLLYSKGDSIKKVEGYNILI